MGHLVVVCLVFWDLYTDSHSGSTSFAIPLVLSQGSAFLTPTAALAGFCGTVERTLTLSQLGTPQCGYVPYTLWALISRSVKSPEIIRSTQYHHWENNELIKINSMENLCLLSMRPIRAVWDRVFICSPSSPWTHNPPATASPALKLQAGAKTPGSCLFLQYQKLTPISVR